MKTNEQENQAVPVMKQLARPVSVEEMVTVAGGAFDEGNCAPGATCLGGRPDDYEF